MRFKATDVYDYYKPSECARRVALRARGEPEQETDTPFNDLLRSLGHRHEESHLATLPGIVDLSSPDQAEREHLTLAAIRDGIPAIYQPRLRLEFSLDGETWELVGEPDFLIRDGSRGDYLIRDSKLARNISARRHRGILLQLQIYGFLYERLVGQRPIELQVHAGSGEIVPVAYDGEEAVLDALRQHRRMRTIGLDDYEPLGWTKCGGCGFEDRCRGEALAVQDVSLLTTVQQKRGRELYQRGIRSIASLPVAVYDPAHHDYFWTGKKTPRLKDFVAELLMSAESFVSNTAVRRDEPPAFPPGRNFAMFDLEGLPPYADDLDRIYLWGIKVFGDRPSTYLPAQAGFGADGDRDGWFAFLSLANRLLAEYGPDLRFVHWSSYEKTKLELYVGRYGDPDGVAARVLANLEDLLALLRASVVLPLPSYSLKVVERYVGFARAKSGDGAWSIAKYIEATESNDPAAREAMVSEILAYNEEDLDATWAVTEWLRCPSNVRNA